MIPLVLLEVVAPEDRPDFEKIYRRYRADAVRIAYRVLGDASLAEDAAQEAFLSLAKTFDRRRGQSEASIRRYLFAVTRYRALDLLRDRESLGQPPDENTPAPAPGDATELEQLMFALPPQYAEVMRLRFLEGYAPKEIGALLRLSPGAVRMRIERAKEKLRALLIENGYEEYFK